MTRIAHRAGILQSFHSGISETDRQAAIARNAALIAASESNATAPIVTVAPDMTGTRKKLAGTRSGTGIVRTISDAQVKLILNLLNQKDLTGLNILPGQTINPTEIKTMGVKSGTALIDKLFAQPNKPTNHSVKVTDQGSDKQRNFLTSLMADTNLAESDINGTYSTISEAISALIEINRTMPKQDKAVSNEITEGAYWYTDQNGNKLIARVQRAKSGAKRLYAKLQTEVGGKHFEYESGLIYKLKAENKLNIADMQQFAAQYSACADCGTSMTNPISIARGVGPICSGKGYTL